MNDKLIAELAHKANMTVFPSGLKEFAELIIQECIEIVLESDPSPKMSLQEPYATIMFNIKDHFGVE